MSDIGSISIEPVPAKFWAALEGVPGGTALPTLWRRHLNAYKDFEDFSRIFLCSRPNDVADFVPCPWNCGCSHKVVPRDNGTLAGICQCSFCRCEAREYTVLPEERIPWDLDWKKIGRDLCHTFKFESKTAKLGLFNTLQIGSWSKEAVPAILFIPSSESEFFHAVTMLVAKLGQPFILFAPTNRHYGQTSKALLSSLGAGFFPLDVHVGFDPKSGQLAVMNGQTGKDLFAQVVPQVMAVPDMDLASRVCLVLDEMDSGSRRKKPSLATVFRLYFVQELPVATVARKCKCSAGTIMNRLALLEQKTGASPDQLRRVGPMFERLYGDLRGAKRGIYDF